MNLHDAIIRFLMVVTPFEIAAKEFRELMSKGNGEDDERTPTL
jgi:hypothetical protein